LSLNRHACTMRARLRLFSASRLDEWCEWLVRLVATMRHWFSLGLHPAFLIMDPPLRCWMDSWIFPTRLLPPQKFSTRFIDYHDWIPLPDWSFFSLCFWPSVDISSGKGATWYDVSSCTLLRNKNGAPDVYGTPGPKWQKTRQPNPIVISNRQSAGWSSAGSEQKRNATTLTFPRSLRDRAMMLWMSRAENKRTGWSNIDRTT